MRWNRAEVSRAQYPTNHFTKHKCRAVRQPGHQVSKCHHQLLKLFDTLKPENVHILSSKECSERFYFKMSQRKTSLHFKVPYLDIE